MRSSLKSRPYSDHTSLLLPHNNPGQAVCPNTALWQSVDTVEWLGPDRGLLCPRPQGMDWGVAIHVTVR